MDNREKFIEKTLEDIGEGGSPTFYMQIAWKEAQKELLKEIIADIKLNDYSEDLEQMKSTPKIIKKKGDRFARIEDIDKAISKLDIKIAIVLIIIFAIILL